MSSDNETGSGRMDAGTAADMHMHSTASDGTVAPHDIAVMAHEAGLSAFALTDHDTLAGLDEAEAAALNLGLEFVRGCEMTAALNQGRVHILGLWLPKNNALLENWIERQQRIRNERNQLMLQKLARMGININSDDLCALGGNTAGRPHMAMLLLRGGYVESRMEAFARYLGRDGCAYVPKQSPPAREVIGILRDVGATSAIAHPLLCSTVFTGAAASRLAMCGLDAIEAWHSAQDEEASKYYVNLARRLKLGVTGGSDYHGANSPEIRPGCGHAQKPLPTGLIDALKKRRIARGLPC